MYYCRFMNIWRYMRGRRQIVFVTLSGIFVAKYSPALPSPLAAFTEWPPIMIHSKPLQANTVSVWHLIFFDYFINHLAKTNLNLKSFFSFSWGRSKNPATSKAEFFSTIFNALNENMVSQFRWFDMCADPTYSRQKCSGLSWMVKRYIIFRIILKTLEAIPRRQEQQPRISSGLESRAV